MSVCMAVLQSYMHYVCLHFSFPERKGSIRFLMRTKSIQMISNLILEIFLSCTAEKYSTAETIDRVQPDNHKSLQ